MRLERLQGVTCLERFSHAEDRARPSYRAPAFVPPPGKSHTGVKQSSRLLGAAAALLIVGTLFTMDVGGVRAKLLSHSAAQPQIRSLAVLPLANLSGDPQQEYFADGMTEELITELSRIGSLKIISQTSVRRYKGEKKKAASADWRDRMRLP
jgi:hypothetical protein